MTDKDPFRSLGAKLDGLELNDDEAALLDAILDHMGADEIEVTGLGASSPGPYSVRVASLSKSSNIIGAAGGALIGASFSSRLNTARPPLGGETSGAS